jgi:4,5-dihydroxyphthalate decarboxylase
VSKLRLSLACLPYDRVMPLFTGEVPIEGVDITPLTMRWPLEVFSRALRNEFDIAEMSLAQCFVLKRSGRAKFVTLPIFPSRAFRHGFIVVNKNAGIRTPQDLENKRIGVQQHQATAAVWIRGLLAEEYGVSFDGVQWFEGGVNQPGVSGGSATLVRPSSTLKIESIGPNRMLSEMLGNGEIDALLGPEVPDSLYTSANVVRLFPEYHTLERQYFTRTKVFPIMHAIIIRESLYQDYPWLATSVYKAFHRAKQLSQQQARFTGALSYMLPWMVEQIEEVQELFGSQWWPYGLEQNRITLECFDRYLVHQGFLPERSRLEEVFASAQEAVA